MRLLPQSERGYESAVPLGALRSEVLKKCLTTGYQRHHPPLRVLIRTMTVKMPRQILNPLCQESDLHLGRSNVTLFSGVGCYDLSLGQSDYRTFLGRARLDGI